MKQFGTTMLKGIQKILVADEPKQSIQNRTKLSKERLSKAIQASSRNDGKSSKQEKSTSDKESRPSMVAYRKINHQIRHMDYHRVKIYEQVQQNHNFRMTNPRSFYLIEKSPKKPIYERVDDILRDKQKHQAVVKAEMEEIKRKKEEVEAIITADTIHKRKMTREELEKKGNQLYMHSYLLINKKNELKMESLRELSLNYRSKPAISEISKKKYDKKADKEHWPSNVVDRFKKYEENRQNHQIELQKSYFQKNYYFKPERSPTSKRSRNKSLKQSLSKGHCMSCAYLKQLDGDAKDQPVRPWLP